jgi:Cu(I)/Ag(I) efflux system membrane protein CusA/SilA
MKRIAAPIIGGVVASAILELLIYPVIFVILAAAFVAEGHTR